MDRVMLAWTSGGMVEAPFFSSMMGLLRHDKDHHRRIDGWLDMVTGPRITAARNMLMANWIAQPGTEWLLMVDTDMTFEADALDRLLRSAKQAGAGIAGGLCFVAGPPPKPTVYVFRQDDDGFAVDCHLDYPRNAVVECDATGAAFMLISRACAEAVFKAYHAPNGVKNPHPWFTDGRTPDGKEMGEDIAFCMRARNCGFKVIVDTSVHVGHVKPLVLDEHYFDTFRAGIARGDGPLVHGNLNDFFRWAGDLRGQPDRGAVDADAEVVAGPRNRAERRALSRVKV